MAFLARLKTGLSKSSGKLQEGIGGIFTKAKLDEATLEQLEELLIEADLGARAAGELVEALRTKKFDKEITVDEVKEQLAADIAKILEPCAKPISVEGHSPFVILVVGVNGNGKTTTIGKLAQQFKLQGKNVMLAAADTFRAAAVEQLQEWGRRADIPVVTGLVNADPASVAYQAIERASESKSDILLIDTAGRLQNKTNLMDELKKTINVMRKIDPSAPHAVIQVLDATTGQNALSQVKTFRDMVGVTGLVVTKLDGTAKGGVLVALAKEFGLPIHAIGVGEGIEDLSAFNAREFAENLIS